MTKLPLKDRGRVELLVQRVNLRLDLSSRVSGKDRRTIRRDLRSNLSVAAQDKGARTAILELGDIRQLTDEYASAYDTHFAFGRGIAIAMLWFLFYMFVSMAYSAGYSRAYSDFHLSGAKKYDVSLAGISIFHGLVSEHKVEFTGNLLVVVIPFLVLFVIFSNVMRVPIPRSKANADQSAS